jgi:hypothetical protein
MVQMRAKPKNRPRHPDETPVHAPTELREDRPHDQHADHEEDGVPGWEIATADKRLAMSAGPKMSRRLLMISAPSAAEDP